MGLGFLRTALIAGGTAAEIIRKEEREREKNLRDSLTGWIDKVKPRADEYLTKTAKIKRKAKDNIEQIISQYIPDENLSKQQKVRIAVALMNDHGNKIENINKAYQDKYMGMRRLADDLKQGSNFKYDKYDFVKDSLMNLSSIKTNLTLDDQTTRMARMELGDFNASPEGLIAGSKMYGGLGIFRKPPSEDDMRNMIKMSLPPGLDKFSGAMPEMVQVQRKEDASIDTFSMQKLMKDLELTDSQIEKNNAEIAKKNKTDASKWKLSDWVNSYNNAFRTTAGKFNFKDGEMSFSNDGILMLNAPGEPGKTFRENKKKVLIGAFQGLVRAGILAQATNSDQFMAAVGTFANSVPVTQTPMINGQVDYSKLISGSVYETNTNRGKVKGVWTRTNPDAETAKEQGDFIFVPK